MDNIIEYCQRNIFDQHFDCLAVGVLDFSKGTYQTTSVTSNEIYQDVDLFFDLASLTKPLTFGIAYLDDLKNSSNIFTSEMLLLLNHRSGLPAWGRLSRSNWQDQILSYQICESDTLYSDFGALRLQLEYDKKTKQSLYTTASKYWNKNLKHWLDLSDEICPITGFRNRAMISGVVHDDNAFITNSRVSHAGLFGTIQGVCETLLDLDSRLNLLEVIGQDHEHRFNNGWDTVSDPKITLAGQGCSNNTFGHLGFTGTSIWIDPLKKIGHVILSNETKSFWFQREKLNKLRRDIGTLVFK